jgi:hypothetical protein
MALGVYDVVRGMALQARCDELQQAHEEGQQQRARRRTGEL